MAYPRFQLARSFKVFSRTAGDITGLTSTTWADVPTIGSTFDAVLQAEVGDVLEAGISARKVYVSGTSVFLALDVATIVAAAPVNYFGASGGASDYGVQAWLGSGSVNQSTGGGALRTLVAGDLSAGTVTCRLRYRLDVASSSYSLKATAPQPLQFWVKNLGPQDPN